MKKILFTIAVLASGVTYSQLGIGNTSPKATLDVNKTSYLAGEQAGIAITQLTALQIEGMNTAGLKSGTLVYATTDTGSTVNAIGYWFYNGSTWIRYVNAADLGTKQNLNNLSTNISTDAASTEKYPAVKTIKDYVDAQVSAAQTTANAALGFSTIYASTYLASTSNQVTLPGYSIFDYATTGTASNLTVTRDSSDDKKYFGFANYVIPGKFKYLYFTNFKSDTKYCGFQIRAKKTFPFGVLLRLVPNATPASTFQSTGYNYIYVAVACHPSDYAYITAITAGSGDGTTNQAADGTSASANTPKVIIYAFDSKASAASYRTLSVSQINTTTHPNFGSTGSASEIDLKYTIEPNGANGVIAVKYKNITETNWTTLYSYTIPSSTTLGSELTSGGNGGFAFGVGNRNSNTVMQDCKVSAITPLSLE